MIVTSLRFAALPLPPRPVPVRRRKPVGRAASRRLLCIDKDASGKMTGGNGIPRRASDMPPDDPVLVVGAGVPAFKVQHVGAALRASGVRGYWLVEVQPRPRPATSRAGAEMLVGFPGLRIERIDKPIDI